VTGEPVASGGLKVTVTVTLAGVLTLLFMVDWFLRWRR